MESKVHMLCVVQNGYEYLIELQINGGEKIQIGRTSILKEGKVSYSFNLESVCNTVYKASQRLIESSINKILIDIIYHLLNKTIIQNACVDFNSFNENYTTGLKCLARCAPKDLARLS